MFMLTESQKARLCELEEEMAKINEEYRRREYAKADFEAWKRDKELLPVSEIPVPDCTETLHTTFRHAL